MANNWEPKGIKVKDLESKISSGDIQIPAYQRGVVWNIKKQKELIESIKLGYPFGSLIIFNYGNSSGKETTKPELLIDGLQRSTALFRFVNNPSSFFDELDIDDKILDELINKMNTNGSIASQKKALRDEIVKWVHSFETSSEVRTMNSYDCARILIDVFPSFKFNVDTTKILNVLSDIAKLIDPIFNRYKNLCEDIEEKTIPYIEITGDDTSLSEIFFRINDRGVKLNKQNKFAATWSNTPVKIENPKLYCLVNIVRDRYDKIMEDGTLIYNYSSQKFLQNKELDVFELTYAFGKYITKEYPYLFPYKNDLISVDSIGFTLINACLMGTKDSISKMNEMVKKFDDKKINELLIKILACINYVDTLLGPVTKFKGNKRLNKSPLHTEFQIVSLISTIFRLKHVDKDVNNNYIFDFSNTSKKWSEYDRLFQQNALKWYLYEIISGDWAGHGDNTLDKILHENPDKYSKDISKSEFKMNLYNWYNKQKNNSKEYRVSDVKSPAEVEKVILNLIYSNIFTAATQLNIEKFDIEHLAPKKLMEEKISEFGGNLRLPISSLGNLCLLPEYTNRKKKEKIIYDDKEYFDKLGNSISLDEIEEKFTFTEYKDLSWLKDNSLTVELFEKKYSEFIDNRFEKINDKIIEILYKD